MDDYVEELLERNFNEQDHAFDGGDDATEL